MVRTVEGVGRVRYFDGLLSNRRICIHETVSDLRENLIVDGGRLQVSYEEFQLLQQPRSRSPIVATEQFHNTRHDFLLIFGLIQELPQLKATKYHLGAGAKLPCKP